MYLCKKLFKTLLLDQDSILRYKVDSSVVKKDIVTAKKQVRAPVMTSIDTTQNLSAIPKTEVPVFRFTDSDTSSTEFLYDNVAVSPNNQLFKEHMLQSKEGSPIPISRRNGDWFTLALVLVVIGFTWIKAYYFKVFRQLMSAFFSNTVANQMVRDENILVQRASIIMSFIFYLTASLFIYQVSVYFNWDYPFLSDGIVRFLVICLIVAFTYSFKMVLLKALGELFNIDKPVATYIFNIFLINNVMGLVLVPVVLTIAYVVTYSTSYVIYTGITLVIISFIYRMVRAFIIWLSLQGVSFFYLILYFCTLEIAPLLIIIKLAKG